MLGKEDIKKDQLKRLIAMLNEKVLDHDDDMMGDADRGMDKFLKDEEESASEEERLPHDEHKREDQEEEDERQEEKIDQEEEDLHEDEGHDEGEIKSEEGSMQNDIKAFLSGQEHKGMHGDHARSIGMDPRRASVKSVELSAELPVRKKGKKKKSRK